MSKIGSYILGIQESEPYKQGFKLADGGEPRPKAGPDDDPLEIEAQCMGWDDFHANGYREFPSPNFCERTKLTYEFGEELISAALSLRTQPAGTVAKFSVEIDGYHREVSVVAKSAPAALKGGPQ